MDKELKKWLNKQDNITIRMAPPDEFAEAVYNFAKQHWLDEAAEVASNMEEGKWVAEAIKKLKK